MNRRRITFWVLIAAGFALVGVVSWYVLSLLFSPDAKDESKGSWVPVDFFPIDTSKTGGTDSGDGAGDDDPGDIEGRRAVPALRQLSDVPVAGMVAFDREEGASSFKTKATLFRWIERATGNIHETRDDNLTKTRVTNTTIQGIQEAFFSDDGEAVVARYLEGDNETVATLVGDIRSVTETTSGGYVYNETKLVTRYLEPNLIAAGDAPAPDRFYTLERRGEGSAIDLERYSTSSAAQIFTSPLTEWVVGWASTTLTLRTKADPEVPGYLFFANTRTGELEKVIENRQGLTVSINPSGTRALFSETVGNDLRLWVRNLETDTERLLELRTLPEKCAWSHAEPTKVYCGAPDFYVRGAYPNNWYQGRFSFDDNVWEIDVDRQDYRILHDTRTSDETFDVLRPFVAPDDGHILFINKRDLTLWALEINQ